MADVEFDDFGGGYATGKAGQFSRVVNLAGAVCSLALIAGLGIWGYKLAVRDVTGIPVIRALEGPLRIAPENPGGEVADNQGLSVNAVAAAGTALPLPETLVLAPRPVELAVDDGAGLIDPDAPWRLPSRLTLGWSLPHCPMWWRMMRPRKPKRMPWRWPWPRLWLKVPNR